VCALSLLGRSPHTFPPIELVTARPSGVSSTAEGFVRRGERRIYLLTTSAAFREALMVDRRCGNSFAHRKIASVLIHEEFHVTHPGDEAGAYTSQLTALAAMGAPQGHPLYSEVQRSMLKALAAQRDRVVKMAGIP
jgi:hypothetical protein